MEIDIDQQAQLFQLLGKRSGELTVNMIGQITVNHGQINETNIRTMCDSGQIPKAVEIVLDAMEGENKIERLKEMSLRSVVRADQFRIFLISSNVI